MDAWAYDVSSGSGFDIPISSAFSYEDDDTTRGVSLSATEYPTFSSRSEVWFQSTDIAPRLSQDISNYLAVTTLTLCEQTPIEAGNELLTLLRNMVDAQITKVNARQFSICAKVISDGLSCDIKVRIYQNEEGSLIELQRRSGDAVAFDRFYRQVSSSLETSSSTSSEQDRVDAANTINMSSIFKLQPEVQLIFRPASLQMPATAMTRMKVIGAVTVLANWTGSYCSVA